MQQPADCERGTPTKLRALLAHSERANELHTPLAMLETVRAARTARHKHNTQDKAAPSTRKNPTGPCPPGAAVLPPRSSTGTGPRMQTNAPLLNDSLACALTVHRPTLSAVKDSRSSAPGFQGTADACYKTGALCSNTFHMRSAKTHSSHAHTAGSHSSTTLQPVVATLPQWLVADLPEDHLLRSTPPRGYTSLPSAFPPCSSTSTPPSLLQQQCNTSTRPAGHGQQHQRTGTTSTALLPPGSHAAALLDQVGHRFTDLNESEGYAPWLAGTINEAREDGVVVVCSHPMASLPDQLLRFLRSEGPNQHGLQCTGNGLSLCPPLQLLPSLIKLDLSHNHLTSIPADSLGGLTGLTHLSLRHNKLESLPASLTFLTGLVHLSLEHNPLEVLPAGLGALGSLLSLVVHHCVLASLPSSLSALVSLTHLDVSFNALTALPPRLPMALHVCNCSHNDITALPATIGDLPGLTHLYLEHNQLSVLPRELGLCTTLDTLHLARNPLTFPPQHLEGAAAVRLFLGTQVYFDVSSAASGNISAEVVERGDLLLHYQLEQSALQNQLEDMKIVLRDTQEKLRLVSQEAKETSSLRYTPLPPGCTLGRQADLDADPASSASATTLLRSTELACLDSVHLARQVRQLNILLRESRALAAEAQARAAEAEAELTGALRGRKHDEGVTYRADVAIAKTVALEAELAGARAEATKLRALVAMHLSYGQAAEALSLKAEARLDLERAKQSIMSRTGS